MKLGGRLITGAIVALALAPLVQCKPPDKNGAFGELAAKEIVGCCTEFRVGYDMLVTDFGVAASVRPQYVAFAQAMGDNVVLSTRLLDEVTGACRNLALDFGGNPDDVSVKGRSGTEASYAWCNLAGRKVSEALNDSLQAAGHFTVHFARGDCLIDAPIVTRCEAACSTDASCEEKPVADRCDKANLVGMCTVKCNGTCEGSPEVPSSCDGACEAKCEGTCAGGCYGTCEGVAMAGGRCRGTCLGTCEGTCKGRCTGVCRYGKTAAGQCDGLCKGGCASPYATVKCDADLGAPKCPVEPSCEAACKAIGQARASCTSPSLNITIGDDVPREITGELLLTTKLRSLELNLAKLMNAVKFRGPQLEADAKAAYEAGGVVVADKAKGPLGKLGLKGSACAGVIQAAGEQSLQDLHTAIDAASAVLKVMPAPK